MSDFVVDSSVVMTWCFSDEKNKYSDAILNSLETTKAITPSIWPLEIGNVLLVAERRKRLSEADSARFLTYYRTFLSRLNRSPRIECSRKFLPWRGNINFPLMTLPTWI